MLPFYRLAATAVLLMAAEGPALAAAPDLVAKFDTAAGTVTVVNLGDAVSGRSIVTIECVVRRKRPDTRQEGCGEPPGLAAYANPAYPNKVTVKVPALPAGGAFSHNLAFWPAYNPVTGVYVFKVIADDGNHVAESNEANNHASATLTVP